MAKGEGSRTRMEKLELAYREYPLDFRTFLLREHAQRRADILGALGEEVENEHGD